MTEQPLNHRMVDRIDQAAVAECDTKQLTEGRIWPHRIADAGRCFPKVVAPRTHDPEAIEKFRRRFNEATNALDQCDRDNRFSSGARPILLVYRVVCTDEEALLWKVDDIGNLRVTLNALVRVFRLEVR